MKPLVCVMLSMNMKKLVWCFVFLTNLMSAYEQLNSFQSEFPCHGCKRGWTHSGTSQTQTEYINKEKDQRGSKLLTQGAKTPGAARMCGREATQCRAAWKTHRYTIYRNTNKVKWQTPVRRKQEWEELRKNTEEQAQHRHREQEVTTR